MKQKTILAAWWVALLFLGAFDLCAQSGKPLTIHARGSSIRIEGSSDDRLLEVLASSTQIDGLVVQTSRRGRHVDEKKLQTQKERWLNALLYLGYLDGQVETALKTTRRGMEIRAIIHSGPQYILKNLDVRVNGAPLSNDLLHLVPLLPCPAKTPLILSALEAIVDDYKNRGYPFARITQQKFDVDAKTPELRGEVDIASGPFCLMGEVHLQGLRRVDPQFALDSVRLRTHEPFDQSLIAKSRKKLEDSGLFSSVFIGLKPRTQDDSGPKFVDVNLDVREAKPRSLGFGVNLSSQHGIGLIGEWSHRNLRGHGETATLNATFSRRRHKTTLQYAQPVDTQSDEIEAQLRVQTSIDQDATRTYDATSWSVGCFLDHKFHQTLTWSKGLRVEQIATRGSQSFPTTALLSFPLAWTWSNASDLLNPLAGSRVALLLTPNIELSQKKRLFSKQELLLAHYYSVRNVTLAFSAQIANFWGSTWHEMPPSLRYYLGSSSSMRGYSYKSLSPLDQARQPRGGSSLLALAFETRVRIHSRVSLVPFYELGRVFDSHLPHFNERLQRSAGLGTYIFTPIGPLRLDVALPLDRRPGLDRSFQLYMSMGSAF